MHFPLDPVFSFFGVRCISTKQWPPWCCCRGDKACRIGIPFIFNSTFNFMLSFYTQFSLFLSRGPRDYTDPGWTHGSLSSRLSYKGRLSLLLLPCSPFHSTSTHYAAVLGTILGAGLKMHPWASTQDVAILGAGLTHRAWSARLVRCERRYSDLSDLKLSLKNPHSSPKSSLTAFKMFCEHL